MVVVVVEATVLMGVVAVVAVGLLPALSVALMVVQVVALTLVLAAREQQQAVLAVLVVVVVVTLVGPPWLVVRQDGAEVEAVAVATPSMQVLVAPRSGAVVVEAALHPGPGLLVPVALP